MEKVGIFYRYLEYITAIWHILWPFGNLATIWYIIHCFGILCREKSGNPAYDPITSFSNCVVRDRILQCTTPNFGLYVL
jgi:hypothetical protein